MYEKYILPSLCPRPLTDEAQTLFFRDTIKKTGREWNAHFNAEDLSREVRISEENLDARWTFMEWLRFFERLTKEIPGYILEYLRLPEIKIESQPKNPRDITNGHLMEMFGIRIPPEVRVNRLKDHAKSLISTVINRIECDRRKAMLERVNEILDTEIANWSVYSTDLLAHNQRICEKARLDETRESTKKRVKKREEDIVRLQRISGQWYREGIREFKKEISEKNHKRLKTGIPITGHRSDGSFDLGERLYPHPGSDPCHGVSDDY